MNLKQLLNIITFVVAATLLIWIIGYWYFHYMEIIIDNNNLPQLIGTSFITLVILYVLILYFSSLKNIFKK